MDEHLNEIRINLVAASCLGILSIIVNLTLYINLIRQEYSYSTLLSTIILCETIAIFCLYDLNFSPSFIEVKSYVFSTMNFITFNLFISIAGSFENFYKFWLNIEASVFFSMQTLTYTLHDFICLEIILSLKNPFWSSKIRFKVYGVITFFLTTTVFILKLISLQENESERNPIQTIIYIINLTLFGLFFFVGTFSIVYLIKRFCRKNQFLLSSVRTYILRHMIYAFLFSTCFGMSQMRGVYYLIGKEIHYLNVNYLKFKKFSMFF